jgi:outer membrane beta-barrel protein
MNLSFRHSVGISRLVRLRSASLALLLALAFASEVEAQDMEFGVDETENGPAKPAKADKKGKKQAQPQPDESEAEPSADGEEAGGSASAGGDVLSELTADKGKEETATDSGLPREKEISEKIYAVQRMYVLRNGRFELAPSLATTFNDQYVSHPSLGAALNYWITNVLAVGVNVLWYQGIETEQNLNFSVRRSTRLAVPITQYQLGGYLNFTYVPIYGKFEMFNDAIFQWDSYLIGGVGMLRTRPVAVIDPAVRNFNYDWRVAFNVGIGLRVFVTKWLSIFGEIRDYIYMEKLENLQVDLDNRVQPATWTDPNSKLTNNVTVALGFSMFFPFTFDYSYPK